MEYDGSETSDHGWTKVENRKQKQQAKIVAEKELRMARYKNMKAEETKKTTPKVSLPKAAEKEKIPPVSLPESAKPKEVSLPESAAKIDASDLAASLADSSAPSLSETSEVPKGPTESAEYDGSETSDQGWTKVENRKQKQREKQQAKILAAKEARVARYKNLKAEEIKKTRKVSLLEAAEKEKMPAVSLPESAKPKQVPKLRQR
ncbi:unnamed protein product [Arabis nemorensis]|uniref:Uncharacterized protein n=1 Tax=Arabis nemorensis TaxID=586526 RepID=A0A565BPM2_9BRAS|nr:unnamed protein product [Arabis nemorensis]